MAAVDPDVKIALLAAITEARASLTVARNQVIDIERRLWAIFQLEPPHQSAQHESRSQESERERVSYQSKRRRVDSTSTCQLGSEPHEEPQHEGVKEEPDAQATIPGALGVDDFPETIVYSFLAYLLICSINLMLKIRLVFGRKAGCFTRLCFKSVCTHACQYRIVCIVCEMECVALIQG